MQSEKRQGTPQGQYQLSILRVFELVKNKTVSLSLSLDPKTVLGDFEQGIKQAVDLCFLSAEFRG